MKTLSLSVTLLGAAFGQMVITDSGSTNRAGMTMTIDEKGHAVMARGTVKSNVAIPAELQSKLMHDLQSAPPLSGLQVSHCMKSASFGSSLYLTYKGVRSPDLSCPQEDAVAAALHNDLENIVARTRATKPITPRDDMGPH